MFIAVKKKIVETQKAETLKYTCLCCGIEKKEDNFFKSKWSILWNTPDKSVLFCKDCISKIFQEQTNRFKSEKTALKICCHILDIPFYGSLYESVITNNTVFTVGYYVRLLQMTQYRSKSFINSLVDGELAKTEVEIKTEVEAKWSKRDLQNKDRIIRIMKYDPFQDYDDISRRQMFNLASDYLSDEDIIDDPHKLQGVIEIVKSYQQADAMNKQIIIEINNGGNNDAKIKNLTAIKKDCLDSINKFAKDNGISVSVGGKGNKGSSSLAYFVKKLDEMHFTETYVNLFDIKTCESFRQFADISNESILSQIRLNSDELGEMFETQYKMIQSYRDNTEKLQEENRLIKVLLKENNIEYLDPNILEENLDIDSIVLEDEP